MLYGIYIPLGLCRGLNEIDTIPYSIIMTYLNKEVQKQISNDFTESRQK